MVLHTLANTNLLRVDYSGISHRRCGEESPFVAAILLRSPQSTPPTTTTIF